MIEPRGRSARHFPRQKCVSVFCHGACVLSCPLDLHFLLSPTQCTMKPEHVLATLVAVVVCGAAVIASPMRQGTSDPATLPLRCEGQSFDLLTAQGGFAPYIVLTADGRTGPFLLDYGATASSLSSDVFRPQTAGMKVIVNSFSLPSFPGGQFNSEQYLIAEMPRGGQLGIIGTDFLSLLSADFRFRAGAGDVVLGTKPCDAPALRARGLIAVHQSGFFSSDPSRIKAGRGNIPVLFVSIGPVSAWAQIDTGYDDRSFPPSIDVNEALYRQLSERVALERVGEIGVATCEGVETREVYRTGSAIAISSDSGDKIADLVNVSLIRKPANACGGIANLSEPAAQLGVSIVARLGSVVFDPRSETVWVAPAPSGR